MKKFLKIIVFLIGVMGLIIPISGYGQNPWNYQRTIRITDDLVEVFEGDGMTVLLSSYTGAVKGSDLYANPRNPGWDLLRNRFSAKNGQTFWIDMNTIQGLTQVSDPYGKITIYPNNLIEVWGAGPTAYYYKANGKDYYCSNDVNYFGVTQWNGADIPAETIRVVEDGSDLNGTLAPDGAIYLAESEVIGVPEWEADGIWFYDYNLYNPANSILLFDFRQTVSVGELLSAAIPNSTYGNSFLLYVGFDDGTSNGINYSHNHELFTIKDHRTVAVTGIQLNKTELTLVRNRSEKLIATVLPDNATNKTVIWESSDPEIATVNQSGLVTALEAGEATITATTEEGGFTASCLVTVTFNTAVEEVETTKIQIHGQQVTVFGNGEVKIHDLSGRLVRSGEVVGSGDFFLNKGVYLLSLGKEVWKIVVL